MESRVAANIITDSMDVSYSEVWNEINEKGSVLVRLDWLGEHFSRMVDTNSEHRIRYAAKAYLLPFHPNWQSGFWSLTGVYTQTYVSISGVYTLDLLFFLRYIHPEQ